MWVYVQACASVCITMYANKTEAQIRDKVDDSTMTVRLYTEKTNHLTLEMSFCKELLVIEV